ncbi:helix-turn-helix domain-containing protein [Streptomyces daliensis]
MPRWRPLPEELDPQIKEFASQLRRLVDRSGMSVATIADRTGYSKSSWERYLNGRLLPPRGATQALAEVTGTDVRHLGTMWELAERAWSRSEMRHDATMEAISVAQARAALGEFGDEPSQGKKRGLGRGRGKDKTAKDKGGAPGNGAVPGADAGPVAPPPVSPPAAPAPGPVSAPPPADDGDTAVFRAVRATREEDSGGAPADAVPSDAPSSDAGEGATRGIRAAAVEAPPETPSAPPRRPQGGHYAAPSATPSAPGPQRVDPASWGANRGTARRTGAPNVSHDTRQGMSPDASGSGAGPRTTALPAGDVPGPPAPAGPTGPAGSGGSGRRRVTMFLAGVVGALVVIAAAVLLFDLTGKDETVAKPSPSASKKDTKLPAGVKCQGADCTGKDPENMGCGGQHAKTTSSAWVGQSYVEVRYSKVCEASWARVTGAAQGDVVKVEAGKGSQSDEVGATSDAYTEMVAAKSGDAARACATLATGGNGCTQPGTTAPSRGAQ